MIHSFSLCEKNRKSLSDYSLSAHSLLKQKRKLLKPYRDFQSFLNRSVKTEIHKWLDINGQWMKQDANLIFIKDKK